MFQLIGLLGGNAEVWSESFRSKLAIRERSRHKCCTVCLKHRLILKQLKADRLAFQRQTALYGAHVSAQYRDRVTYWTCRAESRLSLLSAVGCRTMCCIVDGMDKSKFRLPRSLAMGSKEFSSFNRPSLDLHGLLLHGHCAGLFLSDPQVPKDSSWTTDLLLHLLDEVAASIDLRPVRFIAQADNASKEAKNSTLLRTLAYLVSCHRLMAAEVRCLRTGHSHEDIDGWFGQLTHVLERSNELYTPGDFRDCLDNYLQMDSSRPYEKMKVCKVVNTVRDWQLVTISISMIERLERSVRKLSLFTICRTPYACPAK